MDIDKLVYDVREGLNAISDDRYIDSRFILHTINTVRADVLRKTLSRNVGYNPVGLAQDHYTNLKPQSRSIVSGIHMGCTVLKSDKPIPNLIYSMSYGNWVKVRTLDVMENTIEIIEASRAPWVTFEFPVVYSFIDVNKYLYCLTKNNSQVLQHLVVTGVFEDPTEVAATGADIEPDLVDYPITQNFWSTLRPIVIQTIANKPAEDPLNNSEKDERPRQQEQIQPNTSTGGGSRG